MTYLLVLAEVARPDGGRIGDEVARRETKHRGYQEIVDIYLRDRKIEETSTSSEHIPRLYEALTVQNVDIRSPNSILSGGGGISDHELLHDAFQSEVVILWYPHRTRSGIVPESCAT